MNIFLNTVAAASLVVTLVVSYFVEPVTQDGPAQVVTIQPIQD